MQVLKHGNTYKEIECDKCGALLSYCIKDIQSWSDCCDYFGDMHYIARQFIKCPECKRQITLKYFVDGVETEYVDIENGLELNEVENYDKK